MPSSIAQLVDSIHVGGKAENFLNSNVASEIVAHRTNEPFIMRPSTDFLGDGDRIVFSYRRLKTSPGARLSGRAKFVPRTGLSFQRELHLEHLESRWMLAADLVVLDVWTEPAHVFVGEDFTIFARIQNQGTTTADAGLLANQEATFFLDGTLTDEGDDYDNLDPGETLVVSSSTLTGPAAGTHSIRAFADGNNEVVESNESNNDRTESITVVPRLTWRDGTGAEAAIVTSIAAGQTVYARVEGNPGEQLAIEIWEEDGVGDDYIATDTVTIGSQGFGTAEWIAAWQGNDAAAPENEYYIYYDAVGTSNAYSAPLAVSVEVSLGGNAFSTPLGYDWGSNGPSEGLIDIVLARHDSTAPIDPAEITWVVTHGRNGAFDPILDPRMWNLANAVDTARSEDQVLTLDWREGADSPLITDFQGEAWLVAVAQWAEQVLTSYGFTSNLVNLVGHSWGAVISGELAAAFPGGVNTVAVIDPAEDAPPPFGTSYSTDNVVFGEDNSNYSWALSTPGIAGNDDTPTTADEAFVVLDSEHSLLVDLFTSMVVAPVGTVSRFFDLDRLLAMADGPWQRDQYGPNGSPGGGYEAVISSTNGGVTPVDIDYVDKGAPVAGPGDYDGDGDEDGRDFLAWQRGYGATGENLPADGNFTGSVDDQDLEIWQANFGVASAPPVSALSGAVDDFVGSELNQRVTTLAFSQAVTPKRTKLAAVDRAVEELRPTYPIVERGRVTARSSFLPSVTDLADVAIERISSVSPVSQDIAFAALCNSELGDRLHAG